MILNLLWGSDRTDGSRRYDDLEAMAIRYWRKQGLTGKNKFDDKKYWAYGCHCFLLGDRPMSEMGKGQPTDALDNACKAHKGRFDFFNFNLGHLF